MGLSIVWAVDMGESLAGVETREEEMFDDLFNAEGTVPGGASGCCCKGAASPGDVCAKD